MKNQITKGKVIQNCLKVTAAVVVAGGVGFQFHEIQELNKELTTLEKNHNRIVLDLNEEIITNKKLEQENEQANAAIDKLAKELEEQKKQNEDLSKQNKNLKSQNEQLKKVKPRPVKSGNSSRSGLTTLSSKPSTSSSSVSKTINGVGTAYNANCKGCTGTTASGEPVRAGMVAMARWVPLGTKVRITCENYPSINGVYTVSDRGGGITGNEVDIFMDSHSDAIDFGRRNIKIEILN
ncbi:3D domain-containing protein [Gottfriedia acidiceleris]|uniref:3D domain-containing protein n=1 Tax=Gottfriedia acidiceleris TaxID=371036 RepID=UPI003397FBA7